MCAKTTVFGKSALGQTLNLICKADVTEMLQTSYKRVTSVDHYLSPVLYYHYKRQCRIKKGKEVLVFAGNGPPYVWM